MTAHQTTIVNPSTATPIASDADTRLLKKIQAVRPMLASRGVPTKLDEASPRKN